MARKATRFLARFGNYSVGVQNLIKESFGTGESRVLKPRIDANFQANLVTDDDLAVAIQSFQFPGLPFDNETNSNVSPRFRLSVWDSSWAQTNEGWTDEQLDQIEARLRETVGPDHIELTAAPLEEPFPNYHDLSINDILKIIDVAGFDPERVAAYEAENDNRQELLDILLGVTSDDAVVVQA